MACRPSATKFLRTPKHETERGPALAFGIKLHGALEAAIKGLMRDDKEVIGLMFRDIGPLGNFGTQIRLGYLMRLNERDVYDELILISKIRNAFAHYPEANDFTSAKVVALCGKSILVNNFYEDLKHKETLSNIEIEITQFLEDALKAFEFDLEHPSSTFARTCVLIWCFLAFLPAFKTAAETIIAEETERSSGDTASPGTHPRHRIRS